MVILLAWVIDVAHSFHLNQEPHSWENSLKYVFPRDTNDKWVQYFGVKKGEVVTVFWDGCIMFWNEPHNIIIVNTLWKDATDFTTSSVKVLACPDVPMITDGFTDCNQYERNQISIPKKKETNKKNQIKISHFRQHKSEGGRSHTSVFTKKPSYTLFTDVLKAEAK